MIEKYFIKHLVECQCVLKLFEKSTKPVFHKFPVFSVCDELGNLKPKYVACNNCQIIHYVEKPFKSEIQWGKEGTKGYVKSIEDIRINLESENVPIQIVELLFRENVDVSTWEQLEFIIENNIKGELVKISEEDLGENKSIKYLEIDDKIKIKNEIVQKDVTIR